MDPNPYEELGVDRGADEATIRKAYRKVAKQAHPDSGGTTEAFDKVSTALAVLVDPERRRTYDETGRVDERRPDNDRAAALMVVEQKMGDIVNKFLAGGFKPEDDPRAIDVPSIIAGRIQAEIDQAEMALVGGAKVVKFLRDLASRFKVVPGLAIPEGEEDPIARSFKIQIDQNERQIATMKHSIVVHLMAIDIARGYEFRATAPARPTSVYRDYSATTKPDGRGGFFADIDLDKPDREHRR